MSLSELSAEFRSLTNLLQIFPTEENQGLDSAQSDALWNRYFECVKEIREEFDADRFRNS